MIVTCARVNIPPYSYFKDLPTDREYTFTVYNLSYRTSCRIIYNELLEDEDIDYPTFKVDMMDDGDIDVLYEPEEYKVRYRANKKNYDKMRSAINKVCTRQLNEIFKGSIKEIYFDKVGE